jgi:hypothetical protein
VLNIYARLLPTRAPSPYVSLHGAFADIGGCIGCFGLRRVHANDARCSCCCCSVSRQVTLWPFHFHLERILIFAVIPAVNPPPVFYRSRNGRHDTRSHSDEVFFISARTGSSLAFGRTGFACSVPALVSEGLHHGLFTVNRVKEQNICYSTSFLRIRSCSLHYGASHREENLQLIL